MAEIIDETTPHLGLPQPASANKLEVDVTRLRAALVMIDAALAQAANAQEVGAALQELQRLANSLEASQVQSVNGKSGNNITLRREDLQLGPANGASAEAFVYDGTGRVTQITTTVDGNAATTTYAYNADGSVKTITTVYKGRQRVETLEYNADGSVKNITAVEDAA